MNELISIIVPVYNVERYLEKCVLSIQKQTYSNLEIILVDDGSTDQSAAICDDFTKADTRIRVLHKANGGLVSARKAGLEQAHGFYVINIDSDDWIESDMIQILFDEAKKGFPDIICTNHYLDCGGSSKQMRSSLAAGIYTIDEILPFVLYNGTFFETDITPYIWSKMIKRSILNKVLPAVDDKISFGEDVATVIPAMLEADSIRLVDYTGYHYVQRTDSIVGRKCIDEERKDRALIQYLRGVFFHNKSASVLLPQLYQYEKNLLLLRNIEWYDNTTDKMLLSPFGGIPIGSRVILYAAGRFGQNIYRYLQEKKIRIVDWFDRDFAAFQEIGYPVQNPDRIPLLNKECDFVIVAAISERIAGRIREDLLNLGVEESKIRWLTNSFINQQCTIITYRLRQLGYKSVILCGFRTWGRLLYSEVLQAGIEVPYILERNYQALQGMEEQSIVIVGFDQMDMNETADAILLSGDLNEEEVKESLMLSGTILPIISLTGHCF